MENLVNQLPLNLLIYGFAIFDPELSSAFYISNKSARRAAIGRWAAKHGFRGALPAWFFAELAEHYNSLRD